jgi:FkbM family methyltransferase
LTRSGRAPNLAARLRVLDGARPATLWWHERWAKYRDGMTVAEACEAGGQTPGDVAYDAGLGVVEILPEPDLTWDAGLGMWHRVGTDHEKMILEARRNWAAGAPRRGERVVDLGAHVGGFAVWAARECGAASVVAVEAAPDTVEVLRRNAEGLSALSVVHAACVGGGQATVDLYLTSNHKSMGSCMASIIPRWKRSPVQVPAVNFSELIQAERPDVLKIDVEGAELDYPLADEEVMKSVSILCMEMHLRSDATRDACFAIVDNLEHNFVLLTGERALREKQVDTKNWNLNGVWRRR